MYTKPFLPLVWPKQFFFLFPRRQKEKRVKRPAKNYDLGGREKRYVRKGETHKHLMRKEN
jgi:hypothetical protein